MVDSSDSIGLIVARCLVCSIGILANFVTITVFVYNKIYRKSLSHTLILHQSVVDFCGCCLYLGFYNNDAPSGEAGTVFCKLRVLFWYMSATSIYNLVMLTIERYIAVVHPVMYRRRQFGVKKTVPLILTHVAGILSSLQLGILAEADQGTVNLTVPWADVDLEKSGECRYDYREKTSIRVLSGILLFSMYWLIPVVIMGYCYVKIVMGMRRRVLRADDGGALHQSQKNLLTTLVMICLAFLITVTPDFVLYLVYCICNCFQFSEVAYHEVTVLLNTSNLCINPFIYSFKFNDFQTGFLKIKRHILEGIRGNERLEFEMNSLEITNTK